MTIDLIVERPRIFRSSQSLLLSNLQSYRNLAWVLSDLKLEKSVQCSSDLELAFSNIPQKCVKTMENLNVYYACIILRE